MTCSLSRSQRCVIFKEISQMTIFLLTNGSLQANRLLADLDDLAHLLGANLHLSGNLFGRRFAPQFLQETTADADQPVNCFDHMNGDTNRASLISNGTS